MHSHSVRWSTHIRFIRWNVHPHSFERPPGRNRQDDGGADGWLQKCLLDGTWWNSGYCKLRQKKSKGNPGPSKPFAHELTTSIYIGGRPVGIVSCKLVVTNSGYGVEILWIITRMQWCCLGTVRFRSSKEVSSRCKQVYLEETHWSIPALWMSSSFQEWGWSKSKLGANAILAVAWHQHGTMRPLWQTKKQTEKPKLIEDHSRFTKTLYILHSFAISLLRSRADCSCMVKPWTCHDNASRFTLIRSSVNL